MIANDAQDANACRCCTLTRPAGRVAGPERGLRGADSSGCRSTWRGPTISPISGVYTVVQRHGSSQAERCGEQTPGPSRGEHVPLNRHGQICLNKRRRPSSKEAATTTATLSKMIHAVMWAPVWVHSVHAPRTRHAIASAASTARPIRSMVGDRGMGQSCGFRKI